MYANVQQLLKHIAQYHERYVVMFVVILLVIASFAIVFTQTNTVEQEQLVEVAEENMKAVTASQPILLRIPSISLTTTFEEPLGITQDQESEVPKGYEQVGWYKYSPTPGEVGPSVILGHVDSYKGPAVFYNLRELKIGDEIYIEREDTTTVVFEVTEITQHAQSDFPTNEVYGNIDYAGLRLITCAGVYNKGTQEYSHNLVVYAKRKF